MTVTIRNLIALLAKLWETLSGSATRAGDAYRDLLGRVDAILWIAEHNGA